MTSASEGADVIMNKKSVSLSHISIYKITNISEESSHHDTPTADVALLFSPPPSDKMEWDGMGWNLDAIELG